MALVGAGLVAGGSIYATHHWDEVAYLKLQQSIVVANEKAITQAVVNQKSADAVSYAAEKASIQKQQVIVTQTQTILRKVPVYVTAQTDKSFPLPCGFVRLHDAAASGADPASTPIPAGLADDAACPVKASDAAAIIAENYGQYRAVAQELTDLQAWINQENSVLSTP